MNTSATATADITPLAITVTAVTDTKTYDGTTSSAGIPTITSGSLVGTDTEAWTQIFDNKNAGSGKHLTPQGVVSDGNGGNNYSVTFIDNTTGVVNARTLIVNATGINKIYDGNTSATVTLSDNRVAGDVLIDSYVAATFSDKNAETGKTVGVTGISISGTDVGNYTLDLTTTTTTADITPKILTVSGTTASNKIYDATTAATVDTTGAVLSGIIGLDTVTVNNTGALGNFDNKNVGTGKTVTVSGMTLGGADADNYAVAQSTTTADITPRTLTVTATGVNRVYDNSTTATVTFSDDRIAGDIFGYSYTANFIDGSAGTNKTINVTDISISGTDAGNYTLSSTTATTTATITAATAAINQLSPLTTNVVPPPDAFQLYGSIINPIGGSVYHYHPLTPADMAAFDAMILSASDYELINGSLNLIGHQGLISMFEEFNRMRH